MQEVTVTAWDQAKREMTQMHEPRPVCLSFTLFSSLSAMDPGEYGQKYFYFSTNKHKRENSCRCKKVRGKYLENSWTFCPIQFSLPHVRTLRRNLMPFCMLQTPYVVKQEVMSSVLRSSRFQMKIIGLCGVFYSANLFVIRKWTYLKCNRAAII